MIDAVYLNELTKQACKLINVVNGQLCFIQKLSMSSVSPPLHGMHDRQALVQEFAILKDAAVTSTDYWVFSTCIDVFL